MTRSLQKLGNSKGLVLTRTMLDHLGISDEVEISLEQGRIVLTAPAAAAPRRQTFDEAAKSTFVQYDDALRRLAASE